MIGICGYTDRNFLCVDSQSLSIEKKPDHRIYFIMDSAGLDEVIFLIGT
ncbi:UNVERIFIED_ORG: hypothetical protein QOE_1632 [Clostridioides difficile F501]